MLDRQEELFKGKDKILECEDPSAEPASQTSDLRTKIFYKMQGESRGATCHLSAMKGGTWESGATLPAPVARCAHSSLYFSFLSLPR